MSPLFLQTHMISQIPKTETSFFIYCHYFFKFHSDFETFLKSRRKVKKYMGGSSISKLKFQKQKSPRGELVRAFLLLPTLKSQVRVLW